MVLDVSMGIFLFRVVCQPTSRGCVGDWYNQSRLVGGVGDVLVQSEQTFVGGGGDVTASE